MTERYTVDQHLHRVLADVEPLPPFDLNLLDARGCVLAQDMPARIAIPPFDNSQMDGYAVIATDVAEASEENPITLTVSEELPAGKAPLYPIATGKCARIMTGAPMPLLADAVVPVEDTDGGAKMVQISAPTEDGRYVRRAGEDIMVDDIALRAGTIIGSREIALLASVGYESVPVHPRPRVVVLSTGSELQPPGREVGPAQIPDSNGITLTAAALEAGAEAYRVGPVPDDDELLLSTLEDQLVRADLIVTSGGVSMGVYDTVKKVLGRLGAVDFVKVAMQPGKPQGYGILGETHTPVFALPGNPVSSYVTFEVFVRPVIRRMLGRSDIHLPTVNATLKTDMTSSPGRRQFGRGILQVEQGRYVVHPVGGQGSHYINGMSQANALIVIPEDVTEVAAGQQVLVMQLPEAAI